MEAIKLIDGDNIWKTNIPRGQQIDFGVNEQTFELAKVNMNLFTYCHKAFFLTIIFKLFLKGNKFFQFFKS